MDPNVTVHTADHLPQSTESLLTPRHAPPTLRPSECYHVFMSYSSTDHRWAHATIQQLESSGLQVCYHERDFVPGRTVLENMSDCIQESQKILLVLSPEFVRSRWCLLEANMSLFRNCLERKPIIPVLLDPGVAIPLHLCHLTYLEASHPDFLNKLLKVLCTPNQQLQGSTVVPFQPPTLYNGKALQHLVAVNEESLTKWDCGHFNDVNVPDQLQLIIEDQEKYRQAMRIINSVSENRARQNWSLRKALEGCIFFFLFILSLNYVVLLTVFTLTRLLLLPVSHGVLVIGLCSVACVSFGAIIHIGLMKKRSVEDSVREMQRAAGQANLILSEEKVLVGCMSTSKIYLVYVSLDGCKRLFAETFTEEDTANDMLRRALLYFSSGYACCLAKKHFPFTSVSTEGHLEGSVCFCQYVSQQLSVEQWE